MTTSRPESALSDDTIATLNTKVADTSFFCGGGSVAAITASSAAALTLLVMRLNVGRKKNRGHQAEIEQQIGAVESVQEELYRAADKDLEVLDSLLNAQRAIKTSGDRQEYRATLEAAAMSPYEICSQCLKLLRIIETQLPLASRFTVSDLGAAAALAMGAIQGAILTTQVNVALLREESDLDQAHIDRIERDSITLVQEASESASRVLAHTTDAITRPADRRQT